MRAVLTNFGTTGDLQPFLALAIELRRHGHEPVMAFSPHFAPRVARLGLNMIPIGPDLSETQNQVNALMMVEPDSAAQLRSSFTPLVAALPQMFEELRAACQSADVLISGPVQPAARMVHETMGLPFVSVQVSHFGGIGTPALQEASASLINPFRLRHGLPPLQHPLTIDANSPQLALYAMSRHIRPPQADWPTHYHLTGFFFLDDEEEPSDPALHQFLAAGEPPVVVTFGSMSMTHGEPEALTDLLLKAVRLAGCRAIIQSGGEESRRHRLPPDVMTVGYVPHGWLFPQAACVVHHGGGGTAGAVFRSGVPSVFVPHGHLFDQHYWAALGLELGCAAASIPYSQLTAARLAAAISRTLADPHYSQAAAALGRKIAAEQGVRRARLLIEQLISRIGLCEEKRVGSEPYSASLAEREEKMKRRKQFQQQQRARRAAKIDYLDAEKRV
jgi:sterol 3beta-glucosyltransferase